MIVLKEIRAKFKRWKTNVYICRKKILVLKIYIINDEMYGN